MKGGEEKNSLMKKLFQFFMMWFYHNFGTDLISERKHLLKFPNIQGLYFPIPHVFSKMDIMDKTLMERNRYFNLQFDCSVMKEKC